VRDVLFDADGFEDLAWWFEKDRATALRIIRLIRDVQRDPPAESASPKN
jgi:toxin YoeB